MYAKTATGLATLAVLLGAGSATSAPGHDIAVNSRAVIGADHTVTTSGTYRCTGSTALSPVYVTASVRQRHTTMSGESQEAVCDGKVHRWQLRTGAFGGIRLEAGSATVQGRLVRIEPRSGLIPVETRFLADTERQVEVVPQR